MLRLTELFIVELVELVDISYSWDFVLVDAVVLVCSDSCIPLSGEICSFF